MDSFHSVAAVSLATLTFFSALGFSQPDSKVVKVVEKERTTNLMKGSVFEVQLAGGGNKRYSYITYRENFCGLHSDSSGCPPENFPEKPPLMQEFGFEKVKDDPKVYTPEKTICMDEEVFKKCKKI